MTSHLILKKRLKMRKASFLSLSFLLLSIASYAQNSQPEMADALRTDGKIYVVVLVLATIFAGIIAFLVHLDRKISKLEKNK
jgi:hypothetical protein